MWNGGVNWINLTQDTDRCLDLVNEVMSFLPPYNAGNFLTS